MAELLAAIEAGGTKFNCALFDASTHEQVDQCRIATTTPDATLDAVAGFFTSHQQQGANIHALGIASFGPLDLNPNSDTYGFITRTPKPHWSNTPLLPYLAEQLGCPVAIDTDVNGAALAESKWGAGENQPVVVYITVGTGVGAGVVINGKPLHGLVHPEVGHILVPGHPSLSGQCPYHSHCAEGFASGQAMGKMWQQPAETLPDEHEAWDLQAKVLAQLCHNLLMTYSPHKLILGGGVMAKPGLLARVIDNTEISLNDYVVLPTGVSLPDIIVSPGLGEKSGLMGALALAQELI